tara:strand:- start:328 stop:456 length:129 start_codon:yes stop_codon:yes gene_type:complete
MNIDVKIVKIGKNVGMLKFGLNKLAGLKPKKKIYSLFKDEVI